MGDETIGRRRRKHVIRQCIRGRKIPVRFEFGALDVRVWIELCVSESAAGAQRNEIETVHLAAVVLQLVRGMIVLQIRSCRGPSGRLQRYLMKRHVGARRAPRSWAAVWKMRRAGSGHCGRRSRESGEQTIEASILLKENDDVLDLRFRSRRSNRRAGVRACRKSGRSRGNDRHRYRAGAGTFQGYLHGIVLEGRGSPRWATLLFGRIPRQARCRHPVDDNWTLSAP
jgi:hypothetical protein